MILVITSSLQVQQSIPPLVETLGESIHMAPSLRHATTLLKSNEYSVVVLDQLLVDSEPTESESLMLHTGTAIPIFVNFGINGPQRFVQELKFALRRRDRELSAAKNAIEQSVRKEWSGKITAMLLCCETAMQMPELPQAAQAKLNDVHQLAQELRGWLVTSAVAGSAPR